LFSVRVVRTAGHAERDLQLPSSPDLLRTNAPDHAGICNAGVPPALFAAVFASPVATKKAAIFRIPNPAKAVRNPHNLNALPQSMKSPICIA
jgi:hypothetical protein